MDSRTRWLVAAFSQRSPSTVRGVATRPAVLSAWATATVDMWEGSGQSAQSRSCIGSIGAEDVVAKTAVEAALERAREEKKPPQPSQQAPTQLWNAPDAR